ncbi:MAG: YibE/F family protein [Candidatus Curtissbacteria bacterium]|nr:YibE/F family protein [Candidatus Curtissbacteria bacterium]
MPRLIFKLFVSFFALLLLVFSTTNSVYAQDQNQQPLVPPSQEEISTAKIVEVLEEGEKEIVGNKYPYQIVKVKFLDGSEKDRETTLDHGKKFSISRNQTVEEGQKVVVIKSSIEGIGTEYHIIDKYRLDKVIAIVLAFFVLVVGLARLKGLGSIVGLVISLAVIVKLIVPQILAGRDPLVVSIAGSFVIMISTIYLAHGFSKRTTIAVSSTLVTLIFSGILSLIFVNLSQLTGGGSEDAYSLRFGQTSNINLKGLLLGGMIIGSLGVLDDITTSLVATISEIAKSNPKLKFAQLAKSGYRVGVEHITSLVNTLVLAYAGVALPIFLFIVLNPTKQPLWFILNSEFLAEEVIRTMAGSFGLLLAVPITTISAAWYFSRKK